jgi:PBP1b-binding outer membrane lipoprotein LpoB
MKHTFLILTAGVLLLTGCSTDVPEIVADINKMQVPVIQPPSVPVKADEQENTQLYQANVTEIKNIAGQLKTNYLLGVDQKEMFDDHSLSHQVYRSLTKLEEAERVNEYYYKEHNSTGLKRLNEMLQPIKNQT